MSLFTISTFDINYKEYLSSVRKWRIILRRDIKVRTSVFYLIQGCVTRFLRPAFHARQSRKKMAPSDDTGLTSARWNATDVKNTGSRRCWKSGGERIGLNERDESQGTRYGWKRDGRSWKREKSRAASGESVVGEKEGQKTRMEG